MILYIAIASFLFALLHWPQCGPLQCVIIFFIGIVYASARYNGASILSLSIAHGMLDLLNIKVFTVIKPRFSEKTIIILFAIISIILSAIFFVL